VAHIDVHDWGVSNRHPTPRINSTAIIAQQCAWNCRQTQHGGQQQQNQNNQSIGRDPTVVPPRSARIICGVHGSSICANLLSFEEFLQSLCASPTAVSPLLSHGSSWSFWQCSCTRGAKNGKVYTAARDGCKDSIYASIGRALIWLTGSTILNIRPPSTACKRGQQPAYPTITTIRSRVLEIVPTARGAPLIFHESGLGRTEYDITSFGRDGKPGR